MILCPVYLYSLILLVTGVKSDVRVIGGQDAYSGQFPFAVAINIQTDTSRYFCGGALLNNQWVVTSGHCVTNGGLFTIQLGSNGLTTNDTNRVTVATHEYFPHPDFNPNSMDYDIALIRLRMPITFSDYIQPIDLPTYGLENFSTVGVVGWGHTSDYDTELSETLKYVFVTTIPNNECQVIYGGQISEDIVCVQGNYNEGMCTGDSGGALIENDGRIHRLVGIASFISGNGCETTDPSGYTRVYPYVEWMTRAIDMWT